MAEGWQNTGRQLTPMQGCWPAHPPQLYMDCSTAHKSKQLRLRLLHCPPFQTAHRFQGFHLRMHSVEATLVDLICATRYAAHLHTLLMGTIAPADSNLARKSNAHSVRALTT
jgi:hypothetical protein